MIKASLGGGDRDSPGRCPGRAESNLAPSHDEVLDLRQAPAPRITQAGTPAPARARAIPGPDEYQMMAAKTVTGSRRAQCPPP